MMKDMLHHVQKLRQSDGLRQSLITVVGNTLATGLSAVALILISRMLGPVQFGEFSVGFAIIMILNRLNDIGLNATITKFASRSANNQESVQAIFGYTFRIKFIFSVILIGLGLVISPLLVQLLHFQQPSLIYLSFLLSVCSTWYEQLLSILQALHRFTQAVMVNALQSGLKMIGVIILYLLSFNKSTPLFIWYMVAPLLPILFSSFFLPKWFKLSFKKISVVEKNQIWQMAKHSAVGIVSAGLIENIDILFVQRYLSPFETGLLAGVSKIAMMLLLIAYSLGNVLYPRVARYQDKLHLSAYLRKAFLLCGLTVFGFLAFLPFAQLAIRFTIGGDYLAGTSILYILAASSFLTIATVPFLALFYTFKADWYFSVAGIIQLLIMVIGNGVFVPMYGLEASAWTRLVTRLFLFSFTMGVGLWLYYRKYIATEQK
jgi:O-antigen/teichoic acid export membrane protein